MLYISFKSKIAYEMLHATLNLDLQFGQDRVYETFRIDHIPASKLSPHVVPSCQCCRHLVHAGLMQTLHTTFFDFIPKHPASILMISSQSLLGQIIFRLSQTGTRGLGS